MVLYLRTSHRDQSVAGTIITVLYSGRHTLFKTAALFKLCVPTIYPETKTCDCNANPVSLHFAYPREVKNQGIRCTVGVCSAKEAYKATALCTIPSSRKTSVPNSLMTELPKNPCTSLTGLLDLQDLKD